MSLKQRLEGDLKDAMRQRDTELAEEVNAALRTLKEDGTYDTIMQKYFAYDIKM